MKEFIKRHLYDILFWISMLIAWALILLRVFGDSPSAEAVFFTLFGAQWILWREVSNLKGDFREFRGEVRQGLKSIRRKL